MRRLINPPGPGLWVVHQGATRGAWETNPEVPGMVGMRGVILMRMQDPAIHTPPEAIRTTTPDPQAEVSVDESGSTGIIDLVDLMLRSTKDGTGDLGPREMLDGLVAGAVDVVHDTRWASVTAVRSGVLKTLTASHDHARQIDAIQYRLGSGPCLDAILEDHVYLTGDVANDDRWPEFGSRAAEEAGLQSVLAFRLVLLDESKAIAGLNLYSDVPDAFDDLAVRQGTMLATQVSLLVTAHLASDEADNLARALESNREIGVAMGVLMAKHNVTREQAFGLLRMASQDSNRRLADLAVEVADTGELPLRRLRTTH